MREGFESKVFHDHCDDHDDEDDVEPRDDDVRDGLDDLSLHRGSESVEPREGLCWWAAPVDRLPPAPTDSVGERSGSLRVVLMLGGESHGYMGRSAMRRCSARRPTRNSRAKDPLEGPEVSGTF